MCIASASSGIVYVFGHAVHSAPVCCLVFPVSVDECLKLWKRLRDRYTRELKAIEATKKEWQRLRVSTGLGIHGVHGLLQTLRPSEEVSYAFLKLCDHIHTCLYCVHLDDYVFMTGFLAFLCKGFRTPQSCHAVKQREFSVPFTRS